MEKISTVDIVDAILRETAKISRIKSNYVDLLPDNFKRPAAFLQSVTKEVDNASKHSVRVVEYFTLSVFEERNKFDHTKTRTLIQLQEEILEIFAAGFLRVKDRALSVRASTGGKDVERAYIDIQFEYQEARTTTGEELPLMEIVETEVVHKEEKEG